MSASVEQQLKTSLAALQDYFSPSKKNDACGNPSQLVVFAEHAVKNGYSSIAMESLQLYHRLDPPENQFFIRAHLCEAMVIAMPDNENGTTEVNLVRGLSFILKAITIASKSSCYYFLVENASVLMWHICRPFRRPGMHKCFCKQLQAVVKALEMCGSQDHAWMLELLMGLVLSHLESGHKDEAEKVCLSAVRLAKKSVPEKLEAVVRLQVGYNLGDTKVLEKEIRSSAKLKYAFKLSKLKYTVNQQGLQGPELEQKLRKLLNRATRQRPLSIRSSETSESSGRTGLGPAPPSILLDLGSFSLDNNLMEVASDCLSAVHQDEVQNDSVAMLHREILKTQLLIEGAVKRSGGLYTQSAVDVRVKGVQRLEEVLTSAARLKASDMTELRQKLQNRKNYNESLEPALSDDIQLKHAGVALWNASLPLLQHNLRHHLIKPLTSLVKAFDGIDSLMYELRVSAYLELAKTCAQVDHTPTALKYLAKAAELDVDKQYTSEIQHYTHRFTLRNTIYEEPVSDVDKAAKIIEQSDHLPAKDAGAKLRPLLVKAGILLAPRNFEQALEGCLLSSREGTATAVDEAPGKSQTLLLPKDDPKVKKRTESPTSPKGDRAVSNSEGADKNFVSLDSLAPELADQLSEKADKLSRYQAVWQNAQHYMTVVSGRQLTGETRCCLWGDLAKMARKNYVWDVALVAATFCVQFDGDVQATDSAASTGKPRSLPTRSRIHRKKSVVIAAPRSPSQMSGKRRSSISTRPRSGSISHSTTKKPRVRSASQYKLQVKVGTVDILADTYCVLAECLVYQLQQDGLCLGQTPQPSILFKSAESTDAQGTKEWSKYVEWCSTVTEDASKYFLRAASLGILMNEPHRVTNAVVYLWNYSLKLIKSDDMAGLVPTYRALLATLKKLQTGSIDSLLIARVCTVLTCGIVKKHTPVPGSQAATASTARKLTGKKQDKKKGASGPSEVNPVDPDALPELREAVEACDYAVGMSTGVPMRAVKRLLTAYVQAKQLLQQPIPPKTFGIEEPIDAQAQDCRILIAVEMAGRQGKKMWWEFPNIPTVPELFDMLSDSEWADSELEMELWTTLAQLAHQHKQHELVIEGASKAIALYTPSDGTSGPSTPPVSQLEKRLLSQAYSLYGLSIVACSGGSVRMIRQALESFMDSARFGGGAESHELVMAACTRYWNASLGLSSDPLERQLLKEPLTELIDLSTALASHQPSPGKESDGKSDHDLLLSMFGVIFQSYIDQHAWEDGIQAVEKAIQRMPKSFYLDLLRYKMIFKSRLGRSVVSEMIRFQDESEIKVASLWHEAAVNATNSSEKLLNFKNSIQTLTSEENSWLKVDYLMELSEWLFQQDFPLPVCLAQLHMVVQILLTKHEPVSAPGKSEEADSGSISHAASDTTSSTGQDQHVPVVTPAASIDSIAQLELLLRVHVMMSELHGEGSEGHWETCVAAAGYCSLVWKVIFGVMKKVEAPISGKSGQRISSPHYPTSYKEWAEFQLSEQVVAYLSGTEEEDTLKMSIHKPLLSLHYLEVLVRSLMAIGLHPVALPVLQLQIAIVQTTLSSSTASLSKLLHMQLSRACTELGLLSTATAHMEKVTHPILEPQDLANSQVSMQTFECKKAAVAEEKARRGSGNSSKTITLDSGTRPSGRSHGGVVPFTIGDSIVPRQLWLKQAALLIQQGQYGVARELLNQVKMESQCFDDQSCLFQVRIQDGILAAAEKDVEQAVKSFTEALNMLCTRADFFEGIIALSEVILEDASYRDQYSGVLEHALAVVEETQQKNSKNEISRITAILKSRMAVHSLQVMLDLKASPGDLVGEETQQCCMTVRESVSVLLGLGHAWEASRILKKLGTLCKRIGRACSASEHKEFILYALTLYRKAQEALQALHNRVTESCHIQDGAELPIGRELAEVQLEVVDTLLLIFSEYSVDQRKARTAQQQKSSIQKLIDDFVQETPDLSFVEQDWVTAASLACDESFNILASVDAITNDPKIKAKCVGLLGRCFSLLSSDSSSDAPSQWKDIPDIVLCPPEAEEDKDGDGPASGGAAAEKASEQAGNDSGGTGEEPAGQAVTDEVPTSRMVLSDLSVVVRTREVEESRQLELQALRGVATATQALMDSVHLALANHQWEIAMKAALDVVECIGKQDPATSTLYLALYQSLKCSKDLREFLVKLLPDPHYSQLSSLLCQRDRLDANLWPGESMPMTTNSTHLNSYEAFKRLQVDCNHLDHLKNFPLNFRFLILQHSDDMSKLYAAYLVPPQSRAQSALKRGQSQIQQTVPVNSVISYSDVSEKDLQNIENTMIEYHSKVHQTLSDTTHSEILISASEALSKYFNHVLGPIGEALSKETKDLYLVLLADMRLLSLPLETITLLRKQPNICSLSRDFSLQMLKHRLAKSVPEDTDLKDKKKPQVAPSSIAANLSTFKYVLDPTNTLSSNNEKSPSLQVLSLIRSNAKLTGKWTGFAPNALPMSNREWPLLLKGATGLIYFASERLLADFRPEQLVSCSIPECTLALIVDRMSTAASIARQSKTDMCKSSQDMRFEGPVETAALLSLTGAGCILGNQWYTSVQENLKLVTRLLKELLSEPKTVGRVCWQYKAAEDEDSTDATITSKYVYNSVLYGIPHLALAPP